MSLSVIGAVLMLAAAAFILRGLDARGAPVFCVLSGIVILTEAAAPLGEIFSAVKMLTSGSLSDSLLEAALKIFGVGYLFGISADAVRELGEPFIAKCVEAVGRVEIVVIILPFFVEILTLGVDFLR